MYSLLAKALNNALSRLSRLGVAGFPDFEDRYQVVFAYNFAKFVERKADHKDTHSPDAILVKWKASKVAGGYSGSTYSQSRESNLC